MNNMPTISADKLWTDLMELANIGAEHALGISREGLSYADEEAKQRFFNKCVQAGLEARIDTVRNVIDRLPAKSDQTKIIATGLYLDTVPNGGAFDKSLGVVVGLECLRRIKENGQDIPYYFELIAFCDEEGAYETGCIDSRAMFGMLKDDELYRQTHGHSFAEDLEALSGDATTNIQHDAQGFACFLELHIEQGSGLEEENIDCGVISGIVNTQRAEIITKVKAGHAGTTPMQVRKDALMLAAPLFTATPKWTMEQNPHMVSNIGTVSVPPGVPDIIPDECKFIVELRSKHEEDIKTITTSIKKHFGKNNDSFTMTLIYKKHAMAMHPMMQGHIIKTLELAQCSYIKMPSGAGHDAHTLAFKMPIGMIFVPCRDGLSHYPNKCLDKKQIAKNTQVLANAISILEMQK